MICPKCTFEQSDQNIECNKCGIIFEKYLKYQRSGPSNEALSAGNKNNTESKWTYLINLIFYVKPETNSIIFSSRVFFYFIILIWGIKFIITPLETNYIGETIWHNINLPFHEAGHVIFRPFGAFITSLGGSLGQLLIPFICMIVFLIKTRDTFAASFSLWWFGENFMDLGPYINDARAGTLPLLGGNTGATSPYGFHDWEFILNESGLLRYDHVIANISYKTGTIIMIISFIWGGYLLFKNYKIIRESS